MVWCTGFKQVFDWIRLPILDEYGWPVEYRGVVDAAPGLFFCGLSFQYAFSSMVFPGHQPGRRLRRPPDRLPGRSSCEYDRGLTDRAGTLYPDGAAMGVVEELIRAREAYDRRDWLAAYDGLSDAATDGLTPDDFDRLATAAYLARPAQRLRPGAAARLPAQPRRR